LLSGNLPETSDSPDTDECSTYRDLNLLFRNTKKCETVNCDGSGSTRVKKEGKSYYKSHTNVNNCPRALKSIQMSKDDVVGLKQQLAESYEK